MLVEKVIVGKVKAMLANKGWLEKKKAWKDQSRALDYHMNESTQKVLSEV